jgi:holliday junction DNA helicase RuvA
MIAFIRGTLIHKSSNEAIVEANGIGYRILVPFTTFEKLSVNGEEILLHTYMHVREDTLQLYGFLEVRDKELFKLLISISGIGPRLALTVMSGLPYEDLSFALKKGDTTRLNKIPGVGRKTADRLVLELRDKLPTIESIGEPTNRTDSERVQAEALLALTALGYSRIAAGQVIESTVAELNGADISIEELIKRSLRRMIR